MNEEVKSVFTLAPVISFRSAGKISSYLVRAKLYLLTRTVGSVRCKGKCCQTCRNVQETETFTKPTVGKTFKTNYKLNCNDKCSEEQFSEEGHRSFLENVSITLIDKTNPSNLLQREKYWGSHLRAMTPWGLNVEDCV